MTKWLKEFHDEVEDFARVVDEFLASECAHDRLFTDIEEVSTGHGDRTETVKMFTCVDCSEQWFEPYVD